MIVLVFEERIRDSSKEKRELKKAILTINIRSFKVFPSCMFSFAVSFFTYFNYYYVNFK